MEIPAKNKENNIAFNIFKSMSGSTMEYTYRGSFTTKITDTILSLTEANLHNENIEKKLRKRVFFIIVEGLQNVTRHQSTNTTEKVLDYPGLFAVQYKPDGYYITTGNLIRTSNINTIKKQIDKINTLDKKELKEYSMAILNEGEFSDKGGAGLGLIEMARKSGNKLIYEFKEVEDDFSFFYLHTKIIDTGVENDDYEKKSINSIVERHKILEKQNILLNFIGAFTQETLVNLLSITENQLQGTIILKMKVFNLMVEILQNIVNHADEYDINGVKGKHAIFFIRDTPNKLIFTSGNYIKNSKIEKLTKRFVKVNKLNEEQLFDAYNETLLNFDNESDKNPGLGILDIKIKSKLPIIYDFYKIDDTYSFFTLKIQIHKMKDGIEKYIIQEEDDTPEIFLDPKEGIIRFKGKSIPENAVSFYKPIIDWLNTYKENPTNVTKVSFMFDYYNTATDRQLVKVLLLLEEINKNNKVDVEWFYNTGDISMLNDGKKFKELIELDIEIIELVDENDDDE